MKLNIIGGSYFENCKEPYTRNFYGSGVRGAAALGNKGVDITFYSCISEGCKLTAEYSSKLFDYKSKYTLVPKTIEFDYYHPLSKPEIINYDSDIDAVELLIDIKGDFLYYGFLEGHATFNGNQVVYDPQNHLSFKSTGSTAKHLAIILNRNEAQIFTNYETDDLKIMGLKLLESENAEVVVIKNGTHGAMVFHENRIYNIPVFQTTSVWPIGSGDVFSAVFAWEWIIEKKSPYESALLASKYTAFYCQTNILPVVDPGDKLKPVEIRKSPSNIYLAGPFFNLPQRWMINEIRNKLLDFGNNVFSPLHEVGIISENEIQSKSISIAKKDLEGLEKSDVLLAVLFDMDAGTIFEIGYAIARGIRVVILVENIREIDLTMFIGTGCEITDDFATAVYKASW